MNVNTKSAVIKSEWAANELKNFDDNVYAEMRKNGKTVPMYLEELKAKAGDPSPYFGLSQFQTEMLRKELRKSGQDVPLTAVEELMIEAGIKVAGAFTDKCQKFFVHSDTQVLFPAVVSQIAGASMIKNSLVGDYVFREQVLSSNRYEKIQMQDTAQDRRLNEVAKMADLPETKIKVAERAIQLRKYGRYLRMPVQDIQDASVNALATFIDRIGMQLGVDQTNLLAYRLINGDGNSDTSAGTTVESSSSGSTSFVDLISFSRGAPSPYKIDRFMGRKTLVNEWISRAYDGTAASIGNDIFNTFPIPDEWDESTITSDILIGVDTRYAVEMLSRGGMETNEGDLIRQTAKELAMHVLYEFAINNNQAVVLFDQTH